MTHLIRRPNALLDAFFLAADGDRYVGVSWLSRRHLEPGVLTQGFTGVVRGHRGRGIALALKLETVRYAHERGHREIRADNDVRNQPMLRINEALGFRKQPAWIVLGKSLE